MIHVNREVIKVRGEFPETMPYGHCHCGCGEKTTISKQNHIKNGYVKDEPMKYLRGHNNEGKSGKDNPAWKGGVRIEKHKHTSYVRIYMPKHPRSVHGCVLEHVLVAEKMNGGPLPGKAVVHHIDKNGLNNNEDNLVICPDEAYHKKTFHKNKRGENGQWVK